MRRFFPIFALCALFSSCQQERNYLLVSSLELPAEGSDPLQHTTYIGSDSSYHYFEHQNGKLLDCYKVSTGNLELTSQYERDSGRTIVLRQDGVVDVVNLKKADELNPDAAD